MADKCVHCGKELEAAYQGPADNPSPVGVWVCPDCGADCVWRKCEFRGEPDPDLEGWMVEDGPWRECRIGTHLKSGEVDMVNPTTCEDCPGLVASALVEAVRADARAEDAEHDARQMKADGSGLRDKALEDAGRLRAVATKARNAALALVPEKGGR